MDLVKNKVKAREQRAGKRSPQSLKERAENGEFCSDRCPQGCVSNEIVALFNRITELERAFAAESDAHDATTAHIAALEDIRRAEVSQHSDEQEEK